MDNHVDVAVKSIYYLRKANKDNKKYIDEAICEVVDYMKKTKTTSYTTADGTMTAEVTTTTRTYFDVDQFGKDYPDLLDHYTEDKKVRVVRVR